MQLSLLDNWIDGQIKQPPDGARIIAYSLIDNPAEELPMFKKLHQQYNGMTISGPVVITYHKDLVAEGKHNKVALWQPIDHFHNH